MRCRGVQGASFVSTMNRLLFCLSCCFPLLYLFSIRVRTPARKGQEGADVTHHGACYTRIVRACVLSSVAPLSRIVRPLLFLFISVRLFSATTTFYTNNRMSQNRTRDFFLCNVTTRAPLLHCPCARTRSFWRKGDQVQEEGLASLLVEDGGRCLLVLRAGSLPKRFV